MATVLVWFHPGCEVTERAIDLLETSGLTVNRFPILDHPPDLEALRNACVMAGIGPRDLLRHREPRLAELGVDRAALRALDDAAILGLLAEHPELIQRPMVFMGPRAVLARPAELALTLLTPKPPAELPAGFPKGLALPPR